MPYRSTNGSEDDSIGALCRCKRLVCEGVVVRVYRALHIVSANRVKTSSIATYTTEQVFLVIEGVVCVLLNHLEDLDRFCDNLL